MKRLLFIAALAAATFPALAADATVSLSIGQPGYYGRLDIGDFPQPRVIYRRPMMIERGVADQAPVYMRVPPGHAKNWRKHCSRYNACGERVYFVQDNWYNREYAPRYQQRHGGRGDDRHILRNDHRNDGYGKNKENKHGRGR
ncbi:MAG: hypothetical protein H6R18_155 [Proteobacteria bacterium]|nr:hypothetical protein [Pseudomonadota bacterium]